MRNANDSGEVLTPSDFERIYRVRQATQSTWRSRGLLPYFMAGPRMPRYRRSELEAHFAATSVPVGGRP